MSATFARILIVDDHAVVRQGVRSILESNAQWHICGEAKNGREAVELAKKLRPDAVVMDVTMPVKSGLVAAHEISQLQPECKVLLFTMHESKTLSDFAQQSGARGVLVKTRAPHELVEALKCVLAGGTFFRTSAGAAKLTHGR
jgi:DNA-binding NarL/FixJ family response regulator